LEKSLDDQKVRILHLEESLVRESEEVQKLKSEINCEQTDTASLSRKLDERNKQLAEFENFTVPLEGEEITVL